MSVTWSLTRERICDKALEKCKRLGVGRTVSGDDRALCLEALDGILKNLHWYGYSWPKTQSGSQALTINSQTTTLPTDFYTGAMLTYTDASGNEIGLPFVTPEQWKSIVLKTTTATYPDRAHIDNFNVLWVYPVPTAALAAKLYYQKVISDSVASTKPDVDSPWLLGLAYGVAAEVGDEFGVDEKKLARFEAKWREQRALGIMNESPPGPDRIEVSD